MVNIFQPYGDDVEGKCEIEMEPKSGVLEPREEKSITLHFIANRWIGVRVMILPFICATIMDIIT